jgi:hypothetical protein
MYLFRELHDGGRCLDRKKFRRRLVAGLVIRFSDNVVWFVDIE